jgi:hypothetical protein
MPLSSDRDEGPPSALWRLWGRWCVVKSGGGGADNVPRPRNTPLRTAGGSEGAECFRMRALGYKVWWIVMHNQW